MRWIVLSVSCSMQLMACGMAEPSQSMDCISDAIFDDAILYSGATDYLFSLEDGVSITVRIPTEQTTSSGADALMIKKTDGPAEPNPDRVQEPHDLCQSKGRIIILYGQKEN